MALGKNMNLALEDEDQPATATLVDVAPKEKETNKGLGATIKIGLEPSKKDRNKIVMTLNGRLTIENAELMKDKVDLATIQYEKVELRLEHVVAIDLSVLQLFHYLKTEAHNDGQELEITHQLPVETTALLTKCGWEGFEPTSAKNL